MGEYDSQPLAHGYLDVDGVLMFRPPLPAQRASLCDCAPPASTLAHRLAVMHSWMP